MLLWIMLKTRFAFHIYLFFPSGFDYRGNFVLIIENIYVV